MKLLFPIFNCELPIGGFLFLRTLLFRFHTNLRVCFASRSFLPNFEGSQKPGAIATDEAAKKKPADTDISAQMFWGSTRGSTKKKKPKIKTPKRYDNKRDNVLMLPPAPPPHLRQQDPCGVKRFLKTCSPSLQARTENIVSFFETCYPTLQNDSPLLFSWFWGLLETSKKKKSATEL